ncbi:DEAD/DEAH box helicase [Brachybacterium sp. JHP9]|uniref:DEAD/DEAH box helicase n=1 Tax=Brachybacterium equifaecis TaxID=2910770 RepID=A0ABT0QZV3_9MICO|nr:DEAD/DEAH box helicase [Brachybacterium equifaecis]MCL6423193.1 DEAD/DEAH box helicase [Brachybacterium equifaecis]
MPQHRLSLALDADLGPALWAREIGADGSMRICADLDSLVESAPAELAAVLAPHRGPLRQRTRIARRSGETRVPCLPLAGETLTDLMAAITSAALPAGTGDPAAGAGDPAAGDLPSLLAQHVQSGAPLPLAPELFAMAPLLQGALLDLQAQRLVGARRLRIVLAERFDQGLARWAALEEDDPSPLLDALVDAHARSAFARHLAGSGAPADPHHLLPALAATGGEAAALHADLPQRRALQRALDAYIDSGHARVHLASTDSELVVRLFEPPLGTAWPLQTCLREPDGTVHPVADLRAVGDVSIEGAAEASAEVMRLAPTVRTAPLDETGVDWLLTTEQASAFLTFDTPALEAAGVTVLLPRDWTKQRTRLTAVVGEEAEAETPRPGTSVGLRAMESFTWTVAVGDLDLTEDEIQMIRDAQQELVQLRGKWVRLDQGTLRAAERFLDAFADRTRAERRAAGEGVPGGSAGAGTAGNRAAGSLRRRPLPAGASGAGAAGAGTAPGEEAAAVSGQLDWAQLFSLLAAPEAQRADLRIVAPPAPPERHLQLVPPGRPGSAPTAADRASALPRNTMRNLLVSGPGPVQHESPRTLEATLRSYQLAGLDWMWALHEVGVGGILADDMGLGKTMQILALLCREREVGISRFAGGAGPSARTARSGAAGAEHFGAAGAGRSGGAQPGPTLLVCPMSVAGSWQREAARFAPGLRVHVHHGGDRIRDESFAEGAADVDLVITTYSLLDRDQEVLAQVPWHRLVLDEAQHVKNPGTAVSRAACAVRAPYRIALTGTPVENRLGDLHSLMELVNPGLLGPRPRFQETIADAIEKDGDEGALARLKALTSPFILRRVKTDRSIIDDLPEKIDLVRTVNLTPEQAGLYEAIVGELMTEIDGADPKKRRTLVASTLTRLKQVCNHPAHYLGDGSPILRDGQHRSGKLEFVDDLLGNAFADGERVLLFTQFTTFGHMLIPYWRERFGMDIPFLHGGVAKKDRDQMVADFQVGAGTPGAMLLSLRAGGTGLTLTAANHVVHLDRWWNPAVENQATDRAFRIGQTKDVQVRKLVSAGTIEERIDQVLADKQDLADLTVAPAEALLMGMDDAQLWGMLSLVREDDGADGPRAGAGPAAGAVEDR